MLTTARRLAVAGVATALLAAALAATPATPARAAVPDGNPIYLAGNNEGFVNVYAGDGEHLLGFESFMNGGDQLTTGDVDGDGTEEVIVAGDATGGITFFEHTGEMRQEIIGAFVNSGDKLAAGDIDGDGVDEVIIAGDEDGGVEFWNLDGDRIEFVDTDFDEGDRLAAADVDGNGVDEVIILGDQGGQVSMLDHDGNHVLPPFDSFFDDDDAFAVGDLDGNGTAEILVAGDESHKVDVFTPGGPDLPQVTTNYTAEDGFAAGDVDGDGADELLVAGDESGNVDIYERDSTHVRTIDGTGFDDNDFIVVGGSPDIDADGIPTTVERNGVRAADGTLVDPLAGANPCRPTVFVRADYMSDATHSHQPSAAVVSRVVNAFVDAPRPSAARCPYPVNRHRGIDVVVMPGQSVPDRSAFSATVREVHHDLRDLRDGTNDHNQNPSLYRGLRPELDRYVHYAVWAHTTTGVGDGIGGLTPRGGRDFIVTMGPPSTSNPVPVDREASTFMHELGHALGLDHGGGDDVNYKPNYLSIMNYGQPDVLEPGNVLDFSHGTRQSLDTTELNEPFGIGDPNFTTSFFPPGVGRAFGEPGSGPIDWSNDDFDQNGILDDDPRVAADINGDLGGVCVRAGPDNVLTTTASDDDRRAVIPADAEDGTTIPVIHGGKDNICETEAAVDRTTGETLDDQIVPVDTDMTTIHDYNDWALIDFRHPAAETDAADPREITLARREQVQAAWDQALRPDRTLTFGAPPAGLVPGAAAVAFDATRVYVTHYFVRPEDPHSTTSPGELVVLDRARLRVLKRIQVGYQPRAIAVNPVTGRVYVANYGKDSYSLSVVDGASLSVVDTVKIGQVPIDVVVNPRLNRVYVANSYARRVEVIDGATNTKLAPVLMGPAPQGMAVDEATGTVYVALNYHAGNGTPDVNALGRFTDTGSAVTVHPNVPIGPGVTQPNDVTFDAGRVYVANLGSGNVHPSVTILDRTTLAPVTTVTVTGGPARAVAVDPDSFRLFAATDSGVSVVNTITGAVFRKVPAGQGPYTVAAAAGSGREFYVATRAGELVRRSYSSGTPVA